MTKEIINSDGTRNWQANILQDQVKRLEEELKQANEDFSCIEKDYRLLNKQINALKQENKRLMKENEEWHIKYAGCNTANNAIQEENKQYRSALEEIKVIADDTFKVCDDDCGNARKIKLIINKINEVLNEKI